MTQLNDNLVLESIDKALHFLAEHQLANGEFVTYLGTDESLEKWCVPDSNIFATAIICNILLDFRDRPFVEEVLAKAFNFIQYQTMRGGVWQFYTKWHPFYKYLPADIDDTAWASLFFKRYKGTSPDNLPVFLANRNKRGLFYTWFALRFPLNGNKTHSRLTLRELKRPLGTLMFWKKYPHKRYDVDLIVNINALYFLGYSKEMQPIVNYLKEAVSKNIESKCDRWYSLPLANYYLISRLYHLNIDEITDIKNVLLSRTVNQAKKVVNLQKQDLGVALALATLMNLECNDEKLISELADYLLKSQAKPGNWVKYAFWSANPGNTIGYGSEELTTAICAEALYRFHRYRKQHLND